MQGHEACRVFGRDNIIFNSNGMNMKGMKEMKLQQSIKAIRCSAKGIAATIDDETIQSDEAYSLLEVIADSFDYAVNHEETKAA